MWRDFKEFAFKGNVIDLAVAIVIGAAFMKIVMALVEAVITPLLNKLVPTGSYQTWVWHDVKIGVLLGAIVDFFVIGFALFFALLAVRRLRR